MRDDTCEICDKSPFASGTALYVSEALAPLIWCVYACQWLFIYLVSSLVPKSFFAGFSSLSHSLLANVYATFCKYALASSITCLGSAWMTLRKPRNPRKSNRLLRREWLACLYQLLSLSLSSGSRFGLLSL